MYKYFILVFLFLHKSVAFSNINLTTRTINNKYTNLNLKRRNMCFILPIIYYQKAYAIENNNENELKKLREEANRIIEIIEVQKSTIDLPILKNKDILDIKNNENENKNKNKNNNEYINAKVEYIINNILTNFKNNEPDKSLTFLKSQSSPSNMIKNTDNKKLEALFNDSKYGILFKKFKDYKIENYFKTIEEELDNTEYYTVDVRIKADYNTMIYNGIQFNDMYYPNENEDSDEKLCSIIYRWTFRKMLDNNYLLESCYLVSRTF